MFNFSKKYGIDLGTVNILVYQKKEGIILEEPSVVAQKENTDEILAVGKKAQKMLGKTPGNITAVRPLKGGVIANFEMAELMLKNLLRKIVKKKQFFKPVIMICVPIGITGVEKRAVIEVAKEVGASKAYLIEEPLAAAIGSEIPVSQPEGSMIIDIGGGSTEIAVISMGGIVLSNSLRLGGDDLDEALIRYIKNEYNIVIGERTAEKIKKEIGAAYAKNKEKYSFRGRDIKAGLPKEMTITTPETVGAFRENIYNIIEQIKDVLENTPPELSSDIMDKGIIITGGGALLDGFDELLSKELRLPVFINDNPLNSVAKGTGQALEQIDNLKNMLYTDQDITY